MEQWQLNALLLLAVIFAAGGLMTWRWQKASPPKWSSWRFMSRFTLCSLLWLAVVGSSVWWWYYHRGLPEPIEKRLFQGVDYRRQCRESPRVNVVHIVTVDLTAPGISFIVTPGNP